MSSEKENVDLSNERRKTWLDNIKEMARQVAARTRNVSYSSYYGINHSLSIPAPLTVSNQFNIMDQSVFKTPPEGCTPVDQKSFNFDDHSLKSLQATNNLSLPLHVKLDDSGVCQSMIKNDHGDAGDKEAFNSIDDDSYEFHTPPEFHVEGMYPDHLPLAFAPEDDNLLSSFEKMLVKHDVPDCKMANDLTEFTNGDVNLWRSESPSKIDHEAFKENEVELIIEQDVLTLESATNSEQESTDKDSFDESQQSPQSCTQEEDDSGISLVDENDIVQDTTSRMVESMVNTDIKHGTDCDTNISSNQKSIVEVQFQCSEASNLEQNSSFDQELQSTKALTNPQKNSLECEENLIGWQTRHKRTSKKRSDQDRTNDHKPKVTEILSKEGDSLHRNLSTKSGFSKDKKSIQKSINNQQKSNSVNQQESAGKRRRGHTGKKTDSRHMKSHKERHMMSEKQNDSNVQKNKSQQSKFSYRDALLKSGSIAASNSKGYLRLSSPSRAFDLELAVDYLSSVWKSVNNLQKKDPTQVFVYDGQ